VTEKILERMSVVNKTNADFPNGIILDEFQLLVSSNGLPITYIEQTGSDIYLNFSTTLDGTQTTLLNSLISSYTPIPIIKKVENIQCNPTSSRVNGYQRVATYTYYPDVIGFTINKIKTLSYMDSGGSNYKIRIINLENAQIIVEQTLTNISIAEIDLGTLSNIPTTRSRIDFQT